uniref:Cilia- and flagella-associated protein 53 n=1 Tax=Trichobilharzia regenti TaxID=157069 RepID=A0AA85JK77_TRIRE|nr:unnamed protein product [Trichobilharzia regenti]
MITNLSKSREFRGPGIGSVALLTKSNDRLTTYDHWNKIHKIDEFKSELCKTIDEYKANQQRAIWENETLENQIKAETLRRFQREKMKEAEELERKQQELKTLLKSDEKEVLTECKSPSEEKAERLAAMKARAELLEKQRKEANEKIAREKYNQLLREKCDALRQEVSKRRAHEVARDRLIQIEMKRQEKLMEKQQNDYLNELVQSSGKNFSEEANKITVIEERKKLASFLRQQIEGKEKEKSLTKEEKLNQSKALEEFNKLLKQEKQEEIEKKKLKMLKTRSDLDKCLQDKLQRKAEEQSLKSELDGLFASLIQQAGDEEDSGQKKYKADLKKETLQYLEYVRKMKEVEKEYEKEINRIVDEHIAKQHKLMHDKEQKIRTARENLRNEVTEVCRQQIMEKKRRHDEAKTERNNEAKKLSELTEQIKIDSENELHQRRQNIETYREALKQQIADQRLRYNQLLADRQRESEEHRKAEAEITELMNQIVHSNESDYNRHPWQKLSANNHSDIPVWDGTLTISKFASARY